MVDIISSDWHLSNGEITARTTDKNLLLEFLKWCETEGHNLHLLGDIFDLRHSTLRETVDANRPLSTKVLEMVRDRKATYYYGNHDIQLRKFDWAKEYGEIDRLALLHGHQFDSTRALGKDTFDETTDYIFKRIEKFTGYNPGTFLERSKKKESLSIPKNILMSYFTRQARRFSGKHGFKGVIYGHMHLAGMYSNRPLVANSGSCIEGDADYLVVRNLDVSFRDMRKGFNASESL